MVLPIVLIIAAYLLGSIAFGWVMVKILVRVDLRKVGSHATGGTNAFREIKQHMSTQKAFLWALVAGVLDILKAFIPTRLAIWKWPNAHWLHLLVGGAAIAGHTFPFWLKSKGGKAVSPSAGVLFALASKVPALWRVFGLAISVFIAGIIGSKGIVSVGSMSGSIAAAAYSTKLTRQGKIPKPYGWGLVLAVLYILIMHRENVGRLLRGKEKSILSR